MTFSRGRAYYFSGNPSQHLAEFERLRRLQAYCSHDLRSQLGATLGLLQMIAEDDRQRPGQLSPHFQMALQSARETLLSLDAHLPVAKPQFSVAWILGARPLEGTVDQGSEGRSARLFVVYETCDELLREIASYRPNALFICAKTAGESLLSIIKRVGPQMVRVFAHGSPEDQPLPQGAHRMKEWTWSCIHQTWDS